MTRNPFSGGPVEMGICKKLTEKLKPTHLEVINESYKHNTPPSAESHFKMVVVSELFRDMPLVKRHQAIHSLLTEELKTSIHAISIDTEINHSQARIVLSPDSPVKPVKDKTEINHSQARIVLSPDSPVKPVKDKAKTPEQWHANPEVNPTPKCLGGFGR